MDDGGKSAVPKQAYGVPGNARIRAFSDGVFAIAITLLAFSIQIPESLPAGGLIVLLPEYLPKIAGYVISFAVLGIYWVGHHNMFVYVRRHDRALLWLNNLFLMFVAAMPLLAGLLAHFGDDRAAVVAYAGTLALAGLSLELIWWYATHERRLVGPELSANLIVLWHRRILLAPLVYSFAIAVSFVNLVAAKVLFLVVAIAYIAPNPWDYHHHKHFQEEWSVA